MRGSPSDLITKEVQASTNQTFHDSREPLSSNGVTVESQKHQYYCPENMNDPGLLPMLFSDDLSAFQFDQMFTGGTDDALDRFFADIFCLPSFPQSGLPDSMPLPPDASLRPWSELQEYRSDDDV